MVSLILMLSVEAVNVLVLVLSPSVGLIVARIRRSGTKVFVNNVDDSTDVRYCQAIWNRFLASTFGKYGCLNDSPSPQPSPIEGEGVLIGALCFSLGSRLRGKDGGCLTADYADFRRWAMMRRALLSPGSGFPPPYRGTGQAPRE